jgi:para-nitrobenzyl esterase
MKTPQSLYCLAVGLCLLAGARVVAQPIVATTAGRVQGETVDGITSFKGIPYAAPPVGNLRWKPPQPVKPWKGVRSANAPGPVCPQLVVPFADLGPKPAMSEDCLYLNLWLPAKAKAAAKLPVMVWIHGGGFIFGAGSSLIYDGTNLCRNGVIIVTFNYRLGWFGWFAYPELTKEGGESGTANFGLMDDIAALRWVRDNIAAFGGDPANVTVFGESAGGMSVNALMSVPACRGLFAKAITESGLGRFPARPLSDAERLGQAFAKSAGAADLAALRKLPADVVLGPPRLDVTAPDGPGLIVDGKLISENAAQAFAKGHEAEVPWMVGSNDFEASLLPAYLANPDAVLGRLPETERTLATSIYDPKRTGDKVAVVAGLTTDTVFTEPARFLAACHTRTGQPVYRYFFTYLRAAIRDKAPGAPHAGELAYVFGNASPGLRFSVDYSAEDKRTASIVGRYWTNFAKTGNPNGDGLVPWPKDGDGDVLVFDAAGQHAETHFRKRQLDLITRRASAH